MASQSKNLPEVGIDMTPMIDVVFQLLIFFMLVSQMVQLERAELELPEADQSVTIHSNDMRQLIINIHKDGKLEISSSIVSWEELAQILEEEAKISLDGEGNSSRVVSIRADIESSYKTIQRAMFECAKRKIYRISFDTKIPQK